ncbi:MAG TPA: NADH-ubiquinone oxidoreductase-F iron-sulfur binding region domain-containing protein [Myxococcota bacterium]|nr:NADH-ubiquinone oxidoreductase-F iron-sulfur binding region domain-containing protein [Myxococcota bacterium]
MDANDADPFFPFEHVAQRLAAAESLDSALREAAARAGIPASRLRAAAESHPDLMSEPGAPRVCRGTSCELAGAAALARAAPDARPAYCLGYCDRSPALLDRAGRAHVRCAPEDVANALAGDGAEAAPAPRVRALGCEPIVTRRLARGDYSALGDALRDGAYQALRRVLASASPDQVIDAVERSGERGRGGAGYGTGVKWRACASAPAARRFAIANGDEGDPGSYVDRALMELDPHAVIEGLALCAFAIGARDAIVFVRSEYPRAARCMERAVGEAEAAGWIGARAPHSLRVRVVRGFGSYVCGEETALISALEGGRAEARPRPPYPTEVGLFGAPTVVNNVETLANVAWILERGPAAFAAIGTRDSPGTKALCLNAGFRAPGIVEVPFGISLRDLIERGGETPCARDALEGVVLGGPMGSFLRPEQCDVAIELSALRAAGIELGHGGLVAIPRGADLAALARHGFAFMADESCGRCTPCRAGSARAQALFARGERDPDAGALADVLDVMEDASLCAFGRSAPRPLRQLLRALHAAPSAARHEPPASEVEPSKARP